MGTAVNVLKKKTINEIQGFGWKKQWGMSHICGFGGGFGGFERKKKEK